MKKIGISNGLTRKKTAKRKSDTKLYCVTMPIEMARIIEKQVKPQGLYNSPAEVIRECLRQKFMENGLIKFKS